MSGISPTTKPVQPVVTDDVNTLLVNVTHAINAQARLGWAFAPHAQDTPNMTVRLAAGSILSGVTLTEVAAQNTATITAPSANPRIDRVVIDKTTGAVSVVAGSEGASPSAPDIPAGKLPVARVALTVGQTAITNADITDERVGGIPGNALAGLTLIENTVLYIDNSGIPQQLALGASGTFLGSQGPTSAPSFSAITAVPIGGVVPMACETVPSGFLECNGAAVSRTTYASLYSAIGITHGQGDGSTTFNLPDYRGRFPRGWDHGAARDPDRASRTAMATGGQTGDHVGSVQADQYKSHTHSAASQGNLTSATTGGGPDQYAGSGNTGASGGNETRPINANLMFCIKY